MEPNDVFLRAFFHACFTGDLSQTQKAIATGRLTAEDLNKGLKRATHSAHPDIVAALFDAGASVSTSTIASLPGPNLQQQPSVVRHFLDHGLDPNSRLSTGEPLLPMLRNPASARLHLDYAPCLEGGIASYFSASSKGDKQKDLRRITSAT
ncbi:unnamed protein product [Aspergillus oryzae RIB40]|uniref:DNA, SC005 n=1 Tax=Aspergillus oryzae (strain ATCC 42149 / RIB 40) TaxID=510516 RepID=Q2USD0_ASPOR|nr:unnamed protein product [Aspergillus oryzae RIB40]BAE55535.1 unnamed protein product [Aspergillus oryzae RIB40]